MVQEIAIVHMALITISTYYVTFTVKNNKYIPQLMMCYMAV